MAWAPRGGGSRRRSRWRRRVPAHVAQALSDIMRAAGKAPERRRRPRLAIARRSRVACGRRAGDRRHRRAMLRDPQRPFAPPADATEVLLARHGSAGGALADGAPALVGGHTDVPLTALGHLQAMALAERLLGVPLAGVFVTTLRRTAETAAPLAAAAGLEPVVVPPLREVFLGDWEGGEFAVRMANADPKMAEVFERQQWDVIPGAEPADVFAARVREGLEAVDNASLSRLVRLASGRWLLLGFNDTAHLAGVAVEQPVAAEPGAA